MEEYYMEYEEITFNDIPRAMANILRMTYPKKT